MNVLHDLKSTRTLCQQWKTSGERIAVVPTMGNLHEGHLSLVRQAKTLANRVIVTIFVNPLQFGQGEDYDHYPRTLSADCTLLSALDVDLVFAPNVSEIYPNNMSMADQEATNTTVAPPWHLSSILCGQNRPGHFTGVTTIVMKLLNILQPNIAIFGQKDYQQVAILRAMIQDLNVPVEMVVGETERDKDGLALSSRNQYLTDVERKIAPQIYAELKVIEKQLLQKNTDYMSLCKQGISNLLAAGFTSVDYLDIRQPEQLKLSDTTDQKWVVLVAARLGKTRLIDNLVVESSALS